MKLEKKLGLGAALAVMLLLLYMLTVGKSNWIKVEEEFSDLGI